MATEIISKGRVVQVSHSQLADIPKNNWFRYCQLRLTKSHDQAVNSIRRR